MVTKEEVDKARADYVAARKATADAHAAWGNYQKLKEEYENGN